jgi:transcriptional antiterminator NusG
MIVPIRVVIGREKIALKYIEDEIKLRNLDISAILYLDELKGYIFLDGEQEDINRAIYGAPHVKGIIKKPVTVQDIRKYLEKEKPSIELDMGDIIEILNGPFKGEKGRIVRLNEAKKEVTIELLEAVVPIPLTISTSIIRVIEKNKSA